MISIAAVVALNLLGGVQGQLSPSEQKAYREAQEYKNNPQAATKNNPYLGKGKSPRTCNDKCEMMQKMIEDACDKKAKSKPKMVTACRNQSSDVAKLCEDSCREKGTIDPEYIKAHVKKPKPQGRGASSAEE